MPISSTTLKSKNSFQNYSCLGIPKCIHGMQVYKCPYFQKQNGKNKQFIYTQAELLYTNFTKMFFTFYFWKSTLWQHFKLILVQGTFNVPLRHWELLQKSQPCKQTMPVPCDQYCNMQMDKLSLPWGIKKKFKEEGLLELSVETG